MRRILAALAGFLALTAVSTSQAQAQVPDDEVHLVFHGLLAFVPDSQGMYAIFVSDPAAPHMATMAMDLVHLDDDNDCLPDQVISGPGGSGIAVWRLKGGFTTESDNVGPPATPTLKTDPSGEPAANDTRFRWVPHTRDIFATPQVLNLLVAGRQEAVGRFPVGQLLPLFDDDDHRKKTWKIGERKDLAIADGVLLKLSVEDKTEPLRLTLTRGEDSEELLIKAGSMVRFAAFPSEIPAGHLEHFPHLYTLRLDKTPGPLPDGPYGPTPGPKRCAPIVFE